MPHCLLPLTLPTLGSAILPSSVSGCINEFLRAPSSQAEGGVPKKALAKNSHPQRKRSHIVWVSSPPQLKENQNSHWLEPVAEDP